MSLIEEKNKDKQITEDKPKEDRTFFESDKSKNKPIILTE